MFQLLAKIEEKVLLVLAIFFIASCGAALEMGLGLGPLLIATMGTLFFIQLLIMAAFLLEPKKPNDNTNKEQAQAISPINK
jgi:hypothetical protein